MSPTRAKLLSLGLSAALVIVPLYEGRKLKVYKDPVGIPTVCYGATGAGVVEGKQYSLQDCEDRLDADLLTAAAIVQRCAKVPLSPGEFSAYTSFAFNVGAGAKGVKDGFCRLRSGAPPTFLKKLHAGDRVGACNGLLVWNKAGGKVLRGLTLRREHEVRTCLTGVSETWTNPTTP